MAADESILTTIDDYLLSIAEGLHAAQRELDDSKTSGDATFRYYLPKLDFELKMTVELRQRSSTAGGVPRPLLMLRPATASESSSTSTAVSTVSGSFLAVPNNDPRVRLRASSSLAWRTPREATVSVQLRDEAGVPQSGEEVHFNVDHELSAAANQAIGAPPGLASDTTFVDAVVKTNENGVATSMLRISSSEPVGKQLVLVLDAAGQTETIQHAVASS